MNSWQPSALVGPYVLLEPLGAGGMGEVWMARDPRVGRTVAIKRLKPEYAERFKQEAIAGHVILTKGERSPLAELATQIL